ncbi:lasso peptide biosynthesis B2 protein [Dactylosporangium sp. AC04546]|uniref:lasso peptide biosynthesis B2 protein n=1 Tax=Dactylosporangium sp. AC04546 TaxID=2862460 RepID=UPI001EDF3594|nr:lasso peptide biosynthesis B2 protein [Dactylosporangium sp. AC04546]WVK78704.1 lasso peptide biosynthesis B2 protein [Dactylosporangium sp. AC04546]
MTVPMTADAPVRLRLRRRLAARSAAGAARLLILLPPARLARVLRLARRGARPATREAALAARQAVVSVSVRCAGQGCLQRSVAAALLCRAGGGWPDWCTGFRTQPFRAHAWIEAGGAAVGEFEDMTRYHTVLAVRHESGRPA